jgi:hypothetical protein
MTEVRLGEFIGENEKADRDAIHIAVAPCITGDSHCRPGGKVKLAFGTNNIVLAAEYDEKECFGVIDPFLTAGWSLQKGQRVYVFLNPGSITGLRHHWSHPAFDNPPQANNESEQWLRQFAERWNFDYDEMIAIATNPARSNDGYPGDYIVARGVDLHSVGELGDDYHQFWSHMETLTGKNYDDKHKERVGWSCSC